MDCFGALRLTLSSAIVFPLPASLGVLSTEGFRMSSLPGLLDHAAVPPRTTVWKDKVAPALLAAGMGLVLLYASGFAESAALHNAAHDGRHSASFPCH
jgi:cobalt transporter subunit CbtB